MIQAAKYKAHLIEAGLSAAAADRVVAKAVREDAELSAGRCPDCHRAIIKKLDPRQVGLPERSGRWYNYRCSGCRYMCDRKE